MTRPLVTTSSVDSSCPGVASLPDQNDELSFSIFSRHDATGLRNATPNMESNTRGLDVKIKEEEDADTLPIPDGRHMSTGGHDTANKSIADHFRTSERDLSQIQGPLVPQDPVQRLEQHPSQWLPSESGTGGISEDHLLNLKDEDDDGMEEDDEGEQEIAGRRLTAAERSAARRKMKRFR